jgi:hypothetical protein
LPCPSRGRGRLLLSIVVIDETLSKTSPPGVAPMATGKLRRPAIPAVE